jgi:hypothetical protein
VVSILAFAGSEVGNHERTRIRNAGLHAKMELGDLECELKTPVTNLYAHRDRRDLI